MAVEAELFVLLENLPHYYFVMLDDILYSSTKLIVSTSYKKEKEIPLGCTRGSPSVRLLDKSVYNMRV